ncbi:Iron ABC transporter substrate-binding protein [Novosphingobium sp. 9U]|nr:Iron ABC transporter substrate-binding protein [Novosphingobium sp. 9U]
MAAVVLALGGCQDGTAPPVIRSARPSVVSLNPCSDAILAQVAAPGQLRAVSHYSHEPGSSSMGVAAARRYPAVSGSVEEITKLAPDLVVADVFLPAPTVQALRDLGIRVVTIGSVNSVASSEAQVRELAAATGNSEAGEGLVRRIEQALRSAAPSNGTKPASALVWESGGIVAGDTTLIADLMRRTGLVNAAAARGMRQADYLPLESMLADPPDVILATGTRQSQEDRLLSHPALAALTGTRRVHFDSTLLWCGGPTIVRAAGELARVRREVQAGKPPVVGEGFDKLSLGGVGAMSAQRRASDKQDQQVTSLIKEFTPTPPRLSLSEPARNTRDFA